MLIASNAVAESSLPGGPSTQGILPAPLLAPPFSPLDVSIKWQKAIEFFCNFDFDASLNRHKRVLRKLVSSSRAKPQITESTSETAAENRVTRAKLWFNIGVIFCFVGEYYLASEALRKCTEIDKDLVVGWYALGIAMFQMRKYRTSGQAFVQCMNTMDGLGIDRVEVDCFQMCDEVDHRMNNLSSESSASYKLQKEKWTLGRLRVAWNTKQAFYQKSHKAERAFLPGKGKWGINGIPVGVLFGPDDIPVYSQEQGKKLAVAKKQRIRLEPTAVEAVEAHEAEQGAMRSKSLRQMTIDELKAYEVHDMKRTQSEGSDRRTKPLPPLPPPTPLPAPLNNTLFSSAPLVDRPVHRGLPSNAPVSRAPATSTSFAKALHTNAPSTNAHITNAPRTSNNRLNLPLTNTAFTNSGPYKASSTDFGPTSIPPITTPLTNLDNSEIRKMNLKTLREGMLRRAAKADATKAAAPAPTQPLIQSVVRTTSNPSAPASESVNLPSVGYSQEIQVLPQYALPFTTGTSSYLANHAAPPLLSEDMVLSHQTDTDVMIRNAIIAGRAAKQPGRRVPAVTDTSHQMPMSNTVNPMYAGNPSNGSAQSLGVSPHTANTLTSQANRALVPLPLATSVNPTYQGKQPNRPAFTNKYTTTPSPLRSSFVPSPPYASASLPLHEPVTPPVQTQYTMIDAANPPDFPLPPPDDPAWQPGKWQKRTDTTPVITQDEVQQRRLEGDEIIKKNPEEAFELFFIPDIEDIENVDQQNAEMRSYSNGNSNGSGSSKSFVDSYLDINSQYEGAAEHSDNDTTPRASVMARGLFGYADDKDHEDPEDHKRNQAAALRRLEGLPDLPTTPDTPNDATVFPPRRDSLPRHLRYPQSMQQHRQSPLGFHGLPLLLPPGYNPDPNPVMTPGERFFQEQVEIMEREKAQRESLASAAREQSGYESSFDDEEPERSEFQYEPDPEEDDKYESRYSMYFQDPTPDIIPFAGPSSHAQTASSSPPRRAPVPTARQRLEDEAESERPARTAPSSPPLFLQPVAFEGFEPGKLEWNGWKGVR